MGTLEGRQRIQGSGGEGPGHKHFLTFQTDLRLFLLLFFQAGQSSSSMRGFNMPCTLWSLRCTCHILISNSDNKPLLWLKLILSQGPESREHPATCSKGDRRPTACMVGILSSWTSAMIFTAVMYRCESWTIKKAECRRTDVLELWCWWRLLRVPWTARRLNQSIIKELNPEYSLKGLMLKLKLQYLGHLLQRAHSLEKTLMLGKTEGRRRRGATEDEMVGWHHQLNGLEFEQTPGDGEGQGSLVCCCPWSHKGSDTSQWQNNNNCSLSLCRSLLQFHPGSFSDSWPWPTYFCLLPLPQQGLIIGNKSFPLLHEGMCTPAEVPWSE